jgi:hypothetical protein
LAILRIAVPSERMQPGSQRRVDVVGGVGQALSGYEANFHFMQGYLFGRPVAKAAMIERLAEEQAAASRFAAAGVTG